MSQKPPPSAEMLDAAFGVDSCMIDPSNHGHICFKMHKASDTLYTSQLYPWLEPYSIAHAQFFGKLVDEPTPPIKSGTYVLLRDYTYVWQTDDGNWYKLTVPAGFVTDIASMPWLITNPILNMTSDGNIRPAALAHDFGYQMKEMIADTPAIQAWSNCPFMTTDYWATTSIIPGKSGCDKFFAKVMKAYKTRLSTLTYWGVRFGGFIAYWQTDKTRTYTAALFSARAEDRNGWTS